MAGRWPGRAEDRDRGTEAGERPEPAGHLGADLAQPLALAQVDPVAVAAQPLQEGLIVAAPLAAAPVSAVRSGAAGPALIPVLVATGRLQLVFGVLLAAGLAVG